MLRVNWFFGLLTALLCVTQSTHAQIDLHAHLHMKPGLGPFLRGDFHEPPRATVWSNKLFTRATAVSLEEMTADTRPKLMVISLYAHPYLSYSFKRDGFHFDRKENVRRAIETEYLEFKQFVDTHADRFAIAKNAREAREILKAGKTVIVLSIEGAYGSLETPEDFKKWIDERGLAIITPVHLTPDDLGGNALLGFIDSLASATTTFLRVIWKTKGECLKTFCMSDEGFTEKGLQLVDELLRRKVWIDFAHANEIQVSTLIQKMAPSKTPLLVTHTQFREFNHGERQMGNQEREYIRKNDGIIGLLPTQFMMQDAMKKAQDEIAQAHPEEGAAASASHGLTCLTGLDVYKKTILFGIEQLGDAKRVAMASDINAPLDGLSPGCENAAASSQDPARMDLIRRGFMTYSQWNALTRYVSPKLDPKTGANRWADETLEHFLKLWEKVRPN